MIRFHFFLSSFIWIKSFTVITVCAGRWRSFEIVWEWCGGVRISVCCVRLASSRACGNVSDVDVFVFVCVPVFKTRVYFCSKRRSGNMLILQHKQFIKICVRKRLLKTNWASIARRTLWHALVSCPISLFFLFNLVSHWKWNNNLFILKFTAHKHNKIGWKGKRKANRVPSIDVFIMYCKWLSNRMIKYMSMWINDSQLWNYFVTT